MSEIKYGQFQVILEDFVRVTEAEDTRITESGDTRITSGTSNNKGESSLVAQSTRIPFNSNTYVNINNIWKLIVIKVKHDGVWKTPTNIYVNQSNFWKRVN